MWKPAMCTPAQFSTGAPLRSATQLPGLWLRKRPEDPFSDLESPRCISDGDFFRQKIIVNFYVIFKNNWGYLFHCFMLKLS